MTLGRLASSVKMDHDSPHLERGTEPPRLTHPPADFLKFPLPGVSAGSPLPKGRPSSDVSEGPTGKNGDASLPAYGQEPQGNSQPPGPKAGGITLPFPKLWVRLCGRGVLPPPKHSGKAHAQPRCLPPPLLISEAAPKVRAPPSIGKRTLWSSEHHYQQ